MRFVIVIAPMCGCHQYYRAEPHYDLFRLPGRTIERWILPTPSSRLQFMGNHQASSPHCPFPRHLQIPRAQSVPPWAMRPSLAFLPPPTVDGRHLVVRGEGRSLGSKTKGIKIVELR